ncbi:MAG: chemotaxis protein CheX, partial [Nitrospinae bacterium]|nr:chemotaxis protein CheX [Nitrospinota bacterium]
MTTFQFTNETAVPEELASCVKVSISSVFHKAFGYFPTFQDDDDEIQKIGDGVVGIISYVGDITWLMMMGFPKDCAIGLVNKFTGFELDYDSPDMGDVVGEMANVLAGDIVARLREGCIKVTMSLPTIIKGSNVEPLLPRGFPSKKLIFTIPEVVVMINIVGAKPCMSY